LPSPSQYGQRQRTPSKPELAGAHRFAQVQRAPVALDDRGQSFETGRSRRHSSHVLKLSTRSPFPDAQQMRNSRSIEYIIH